jgi:hypothetical protein
MLLCKIKIKLKKIKFKKLYKNYKLNAITKICKRGIIKEKYGSYLFFQQTNDVYRYVSLALCWVIVVLNAVL